MTQPDIFLSYNREDAATAKRFADAFAAEGLNVWWDTALRSGEAYDEVTEAALRGAKAVVVLWSPRSVVSRWVRAEATIADRCKTLVPVTIEPCERPIMFELTQTAELSHWTGDASDNAWRAFLSDVRGFVGREVLAPSSSVEAPPLQTLADLQPLKSDLRATLSSDRIGLAVLPFLDVSAARDQSAFLDGLSEELGTVLSRNDSLALAGASGVPRDPARDLKTIAQTLGVRYFLDGSVRGAGGRLRVAVRLISALSGAQLWQERFDGDVADEFDLQERIANSVNSQIVHPVGVAEFDRVRALSPEHRSALDWHMLALTYSMDWRRESLDEARRCALEALRINPDFPLVHACLGWIYSVIYQSAWNDDPDETRQLGLEHSAKALNAAERDLRVLGFYAAAHTSFGTDMSVVEAMIVRAQARVPQDISLMQVRAWAIFCQGGRPQAALELIRDCMARDPDSPLISYCLILEAACLLLLKRFDEAIPPARETVARRPDYLNADVIFASALGHAGFIDEARERIAGFKDKGRTENSLAMLRNLDERAFVRRGLELAGLDD
jgi:TolB-like protein